MKLLKTTGHYVNIDNITVIDTFMENNLYYIQIFDTSGHAYRLPQAFNNIDERAKLINTLIDSSWLKTIHNEHNNRAYINPQFIEFFNIGKEDDTFYVYINVMNRPYQYKWNLFNDYASCEAFLNAFM